MNFSPFASTFISCMVNWCDEKFLTNCFALVSSLFRSFCVRLHTTGTDMQLYYVLT